ncbi:MAG TPA: hypothetical protein VF958_00780 [Thermoanaerobaculia bacterium]
MKRTVLLVLSSILIATCASQNTNKVANAAPTAASYVADSKTIPVGVIPSAIVHDAVRIKDLELSIDYPAKDGPYPVIIFSPGYGSSNLTYVGTSSFWASHGYVVMKPKHADAGALRPAENEMPGERPEQRREGRRDRRQQNADQPPQPRVCHPNPAEVWDGQTPADWQNRVADIRLILDNLGKLVEQYPELKPRLDATKIGVGGHSYGAFTALLVGGVRTFNAAGAPATYADPRVKAVVAMSPPGPGPSHGLTNQSWADLRLPVLFLTGTRDFGATESEDLPWRKQAFELAPTGDKWFVSLNGVSAASFTGRVADVITYDTALPPSAYPGNRPVPGGAPPQYTPPPDSRRGTGISFGQQNLINAVRIMSLAFWDTYLKNATAGREYLSKLKDRGDAEVLSK